MHEPHYQVLQNGVRVGVVPVKVVDELRAQEAGRLSLHLRQLLVWGNVCLRVAVQTLTGVAALIGALLLVAALLDPPILADVARSFIADPEGAARFIGSTANTLSVLYLLALGGATFLGYRLPGFRNLFWEAQQRHLRMLLNVPGDGALELEPAWASQPSREV
jgi:hypothetical protein